MDWAESNMTNSSLSYISQYFKVFLFKNQTREMINVSTIALIHYFSWWSSFRSICDTSNILKWEDCKIFTKLVPLKTPSSSSHQKCSIKKGIPKNLLCFTRKHLCWSLFLIKSQIFRPATVLRRDTNAGYFLWNLRNF